MSTRQSTWSLTPDAFDSLLLALHSDRDQAGRVYENLRRKLLEFFEARGSHTPEEHTDETFDRVMRRIAEGEEINNPGGYCYGVARFVWKEAIRNRSREPVELDDNLVHPVSRNGDELAAAKEIVERKLDCLETCLASLHESTRDFIFEYYREERGSKIERRKLLAESLNTSINALRLRASRLRRELAKCTEKCIQTAGGGDGIE